MSSRGKIYHQNILVVDRHIQNVCICIGSSDLEWILSCVEAFIRKERNKRRDKHVLS